MRRIELFWIRRIELVSFVVFGKYRHRYAVSSLMDTAYCKVGSVAYRLELPQELSGIHNVFHVSNLRKCLSDETLDVPLKELKITDKLQFIEESLEIIDRDVKRLKQSQIPIVKVRWNSRRGLEFTWEREDEIKRKYPHFFRARNLWLRRAESRDGIHFNDERM
ncbi:hypothetical protein Tco_1044600 [Tanacetum coccineum]|uniref:Tf2-1-like SH3-like domain-containing protein n=1 Tax=Tanacetum coccineum TaxID=301880 RepID=A0ABQ5GR33_9ASTR